MGSSIFLYVILIEGWKGTDIEVASIARLFLSKIVRQRRTESENKLDLENFSKVELE